MRQYQHHSSKLKTSYISQLLSPFVLRNIKCYKSQQFVVKHILRYHAQKINNCLLSEQYVTLFLPSVQPAILFH